MLSVLYFTVMVLILFGITIFIHELGHFLVARRLGMRADVFSIGFGHAIWKKEHGGVLYKVGWIPCGGYVALPQMEPGGGRTLDAEGREVRLPRVAPWKKILVALAGAAGNMVLAVILAFVIYWHGKPSSLQEVSTVVGFVDTNSVAHARGLRIGDEILRVNGRAVDSWDDVNLATALSETDDVSLLVRGVGGERSITLATEDGALGVRGINGIPGVEGPSYCVVGSSVEGSSAEEAGLLPGDMVLSFNGVRLHSIHHMVEEVGKVPDQAVPIVVERMGEQVNLQVTPRWNEAEQMVMIGIRFDQFHVNMQKRVHPTPAEQLSGHAGMIFTTLKALVTPKQAKKAARAIGGPPMIFQYLWAMLQTSFIMALWFTCLLNVNLAIINLVPLPVLDGGHIVFALIEWVARRPLHERVVTSITAVFATLLIGAMLYLSYRDIDRMVNPMGAEPDETEEAAPRPGTPAPDPAP
jgi:regulator of sigma E protease